MDPSKYGVRPSKSLGQNFIRDMSVIERIVEGAGIGPDDMVIEIGPGLGVLTSELASHAAFVTAVEIDGRLIPVLEETQKDYDNVRIINRDILKQILDSLLKRADQKAGFRERCT